METREEHYESMMQAVKRYSPAADLDVIQRAFEYANEKHKKQLCCVLNHFAWKH